MSETTTAPVLTPELIARLHEMAAIDVSVCVKAPHAPDTAYCAECGYAPLIRDVTAAYEAQRSENTKLWAEWRRLTAEVAALTADRERIEWLEQHRAKSAFPWCRVTTDGETVELVGYAPDPFGYGKQKPTVREALDAARAQDTKE